MGAAEDGQLVLLPVGVEGEAYLLAFYRRRDFQIGKFAWHVGPPCCAQLVVTRWCGARLKNQSCGPASAPASGVRPRMFRSSRESPWGWPIRWFRGQYRQPRRAASMPPGTARDRQGALSATHGRFARPRSSLPTERAVRYNFPGKENEMSGTSIQAVSKAEPAAVLSKAVTRAADHLHIQRSLLAKVLGISAATVSRLYSGAYQLDQKRKEWELAVLFVRAFRSLDSIVGDQETACKWLASNNRGLNGRPVDLIANTEGLVRVVHYLDASRSLV